MNKSAIILEKLSKSFKAVTVLKELDLNVPQGSVLGLLGPNGAGKTTTVRILSTLLKPDVGRAIVNGFDVNDEPDQVRQSIGLTGQFAAVDEYLSGRENLIMIGRLYHLGGRQAKERAQELLTRFELTDAADRPAKTYSGGMRRRLDLALSLVASPKIIFLDEPTTGLDPRSRLTVWEIVADLKKTGTTILLTTQNLDEADRLADRIAVLDHGVIIAQGAPQELKNQVGEERLEFTVSAQSDFAVALSALADKTPQSDKEDRSISIATGGTVSEVKQTLDRLESAGIKIDDLSLRKPTLDDVFMQLTGHETTNNN